MGYLGADAAFVNKRLGFLLMADKSFSVFFILWTDCYIFVLLREKLTTRKINYEKN
jgi:hypothetical protein